MPKGPAWQAGGHGGLVVIVAVTQGHFYIPISPPARHSFQSQGKYTWIGLLPHPPTGHYTLHAAGILSSDQFGRCPPVCMQEVTVTATITLCLLGLPLAHHRPSHTANRTCVCPVSPRDGISWGARSVRSGNLLCRRARRDARDGGLSANLSRICHGSARWDGGYRMGLSASS
jgi:hypothetical protein